MKILKYLIGIIILFFLAMLIIGFLLPKQMEVERSVTIDKPASEVFTKINNLRNWDSWSPWYNLDPNTVWEYGGRGEGQGAWYTWASEQNDVGSGKFTITESVPNEKILAEMEFEGMGTANTGFYFTEQNGITKLVWNFDSEIGNNPIARIFANTLGKRSLGGQYQQGLDKLKKVVEGN